MSLLGFVMIYTLYTQSSAESRPSNAAIHIIRNHVGNKILPTCRQNKKKLFIISERPCPARSLSTHDFRRIGLGNNDEWQV
jgi:hypothetical protein